MNWKVILSIAFIITLAMITPSKYWPKFLPTKQFLADSIEMYWFDWRYYSSYIGQGIIYLLIFFFILLRDEIFQSIKRKIFFIPRKLKELEEKIYQTNSNLKNLKQTHESHLVRLIKFEKKVKYNDPDAFVEKEDKDQLADTFLNGD